MAPLVVLVASTLIMRGLGRLGVRPFSTWRDSARFAMAIMLVFTATSHFTAMKRDLAAMIPEPLTGNLPVIYVVGLLEIAGAIGILMPRTRRLAGVCLVLLLLALLPANVNAALRGLTLRGEPVTPLWLRIPLQVLFIAVIWWTSIVRSAGERDRAASGA